MKKLFIFLTMAALLPFSSVCVNASPISVQLQVRYDDPNDDQDPDPKTPVLVPEVNIDDYTLTFDDSCLGCELRLVDENDNVVYTTVITSNTLVLPSYLSGEYELQIFSGIYCFYGYIEL